MIVRDKWVGRNEIFSSVPVALVSTGCSGCEPTVLVGSPRQLGTFWGLSWAVYGGRCGSTGISGGGGLSADFAMFLGLGG